MHSESSCTLFVHSGSSFIFSCPETKIRAFLRGLIDSGWFNGNANIVTYALDELIATKLRALYQRRKGRDLFDIWYVAERNLINLDQVLEIFYKYCRYSKVDITGNEFLKNLRLKKNHRDFHMDMSVLLPSKLHWDFNIAYDFVVEKVISKML